MSAKFIKTKAEWKQTLTDEQYKVTREKATERAFTGEYWNHFEEGAYHCTCCGERLFKSNTKFDSGCGWPSFYEVVDKGKIKTLPDYSLGVERIEILCANCDAHLGHVFDDGPQPSGLRYCVNSIAIKFDAKN